jgi:hypothetical protein
LALTVEMVMPRYFIDTDNGSVFTIDDEGIVLANDDAARFEALAALPYLTKGRMPEGDNSTYRVSARNEAGEIVYATQMSFLGGLSDAISTGTIMRAR